MVLVKKLPMEELLLHALAYMVHHPGRPCHSLVKKENGKSRNGFVVVRGKHPRAAGQMGDILALAEEMPDRMMIREVALFVVDGKNYFPDVYYDVKGKVEKKA